MNMNELARKIAKKETGKKEVSIAQIKEIMGIIADEILEDSTLAMKFFKLGERRLKRK